MQKTFGYVFKEMTLKRLSVSAVFTFCMFLSSYSLSNDVSILGADFQLEKGNSWSVNVALLHEDSGWDHYADIWRVVDSKGQVLGERLLLHPHEDEQPFARETNGVIIPEDVEVLFIEAHDTVHGWTENRLEIDFTQVKNGRLRVVVD